MFLCFVIAYVLNKLKHEHTAEPVHYLKYWKLPVLQLRLDGYLPVHTATHILLGVNAARDPGCMNLITDPEWCSCFGCPAVTLVSKQKCTLVCLIS